MRLFTACPSRSPAPLPLLPSRALPQPLPFCRRPRARRRALAPLLLLLAAAALAGAGCGRHGSAAAPRAGGQASRAARDQAGSGAGVADGGAPRRGGTVVTGWTAEPAGVNELVAAETNPTTELMLQLFLRLVREEPDFERHPPTFSPSLARSYDWSPDHKALTFHLREDALWSDGVPVTADDVRWTWQAQTSPEVGWPYKFMKANIADVEVVDAHTARFRFRRVDAKQLLDANEAGIMPRHAWAQLPFARWRQSADWFKQHLVVDGPFTIASWKPQQELVLARNPRYFDPSRPYLDRVVMRIIPDHASILTQLASGELDFTPVVSPSAAPQVTANPRLRLLAFWYRTWVGIGWNGARQPFGDADVRRALSLALDRRAIAETLWGQYGQVAESPILDGVWAHDRALQPLPHDPALARRILAAKGFTPGPDGILRRGGKPFAFEIVTNNGNQQRVDSLVMIQEQLRRIGVQAVPRQMEFNALNARTEAGDFDAAVLGTTMDTSLDLSAEFHSRSIGSENGINITHYRNPEVDRLIDRAMSRPDIALAKPDLDRIQEILHRDQPYTFLWESRRLSVLDRRLHGARPSLFSFYDLKDWWLEPPPRR